MADQSKPTLEGWGKLAAGELGGKGAETLTWHTLEGIPIKQIGRASCRERV